MQVQHFRLKKSTHLRCQRINKDYLINENIPAAVVSSLRGQGHDVTWIRTTAPGLSDIEVLEIAQKENRILITFDKDFGELAFRFGMPAQCGIVLFRISMPSSRYIARVVRNALESRNDWTGHFSVIEDDRIRMRPLPEVNS